MEYFKYYNAFKMCGFDHLYQNVHKFIAVCIANPRAAFTCDGASIVVGQDATAQR